MIRTCIQYRSPCFIFLPARAGCRVQDDFHWVNRFQRKIWGVEIEKEGQELSESKNGSSNYLGAVK